MQMNPSGAVKSFEEIYKTAYSHGLENIYALENVDIKTVRIFGGEKARPAEKKSLCQALPEEDPQQLFDFGMSYRVHMQPFVLREPIQVLGLTRYIENNLSASGKSTLGDLLSLKGMSFGQGHIEEIQKKLHEYLAGRHLARTRRIDYMAWLKSIAADIDKKKIHVALEPYALHQAIPLSTGEAIETKRLTLEKRTEWCEQVDKALLCEGKKNQIDKDFWEICEVFVKPWMECRQGLATESELQERMLFLSSTGGEAYRVLEFFSDFFFNGAFPLNRYLEPIDAGVFASAAWIADQYDMVVEKARSYFFKSETIYPFAALVGYIAREFALDWIGFREGFLERALKICPAFYVYKNSAGVLCISLS